MTNDELYTACIEAGACEFLLRVCQMGPDLETPEKWQALVKHWNANLAWGSKVGTDPVEAMRCARENFLQHHGTPTPKPRKRTRAPAPRTRTRVRKRATPS